MRRPVHTSGFLAHQSVYSSIKLAEYMKYSSIKLEICYLNSLKNSIFAAYTNSMAKHAGKEGGNAYRYE